MPLDSTCRRRCTSFSPKSVFVEVLHLSEVTFNLSDCLQASPCACLVCSACRRRCVDRFCMFLRPTRSSGITSRRNSASIDLQSNTCRPLRHPWGTQHADVTYIVHALLGTFGTEKGPGKHSCLIVLCHISSHPMTTSRNTTRIQPKEQTPKPQPRVTLQPYNLRPHPHTGARERCPASPAQSKQTAAATASSCCEPSGTNATLPKPEEASASA